MTRCQIEHISDPKGLPRDYCLKKAKHTVTFKSNHMGSFNKYKFRICDDHFYPLKAESEEDWGLADGRKRTLRFTFKENRL